MIILHEVDKPGSNIDNYVNSLDNLLNKKLELVNSMKPRILQFKDHLKEEDVLAKKYYELLNQTQTGYGQGQIGVQEQIYNPAGRNFF